VNDSARQWWEDRRLLALIILLMAVPLIWPTVPPLVDLPGHMGRYQVQLLSGKSTILDSYFAFHWRLIGNLGVDLLIIPLSKLFGLELAVKLVVLTIPPLTAAGLLWIAHEVHGRIPPTAFFALPLAFGYPFMFGFVNFALAMALALIAFALWLRLARLNRDRLRAILFPVIGLTIWVCHIYGWGLLGLLAFSAEVVRQKDRGLSLAKSGVNAAIQCLSLLPPVLLMIMWRSGSHAGGQTGGWFNFDYKLRWALMALSDRSKYFDLMSLGIICAVLAIPLWSSRLTYSRNLFASAVVLLTVFLLLPRVLFGSAYADMRLFPFFLAILVLAVRFKLSDVRKFGTVLAAVGLLFLSGRLIGHAISFHRYAVSQNRALEALDLVPPGAQLVSFVGAKCTKLWSTNHMEHLPSLAIVRRSAFANDQWTMAGAQLISVKKNDAPGFVKNPSQLVTETKCPGNYWTVLDTALRSLPKNAFDYVWLIDPPRFHHESVNGLTQIWANGRDSLYRIDRLEGKPGDRP
jgi:hypothetical protein